MILEQLPELKGMSSSEKRMLAQELVQAADSEDGRELDLAIIELLDQRLADYDANPEAVSSWADVQRRVFGKS